MLDYLRLVLIGVFSGFLATTPMTIFEVIPFKFFGTEGVLEWHENLKILTRLFHGLEPSFLGIFTLHFLNGALAAVPLPFVLAWLNTSSLIIIVWYSLIYGLIVWIVTLYPIHKPLTGYDPLKHPMGLLPLVSSLIGHMIYGTISGLVVFWLR